MSIAGNEKDVREQLNYCGMMFRNLDKSMNDFINFGGCQNTYGGSIFRNRNCGRTVLRGKIVSLRRELQILQEMLENN